jgi:hypothetical protein
VESKPQPAPSHKERAAQERQARVKPLLDKTSYEIRLIASRWISSSLKRRAGLTISG